MGLLRSKTYAEPLTVNGILLGTPVLLVRDGDTMRPQQPGDGVDALWFCWDDSALPSGVLNDDGSITPDGV